MMPIMNGIDACKEIRKNSQVPIIMLTAKGEEIDRILGLELGADDNIVKPFSPREVVARIKAVLRRTSEQQSITATAALP
ncbi:MAG: response regulator [Christensenellales bacterium]